MQNFFYLVKSDVTLRLKYGYGAWSAYRINIFKLTYIKIADTAKMLLTCNEERIFHCAVAFFILGQAGVPSWLSGIFDHQGTHNLHEANNDGMINEDSRHKYKSARD